MKLKKIMILVLVIGVCYTPLMVSSNTETERWAFGPWQTQSMISWGNDMLVVDFGQNGLWSYDGSWIRLSILDPKSMITMGESNLIVDFGSRGLWKFDKLTWEKIAL